MMSKDDVVYNIELYDRKPKPDLQGWAFLLSVLWHFLKTPSGLYRRLWILDTPYLNRESGVTSE